ncbi:hypothetical protein [Nocardia flavorosea]|uniref:hypothetical protein n=1 Tax=Nocardia flavorosea TaxID=53429 RepID=UPI000ACA3F6C|nr:hypothetical protein [Nocardia flavorosea]
MAIAELPAAIALIRRDVPIPAVDLSELAARQGYRLVFTVFTGAGPFVTALAVARHVEDYAAEAVVVPGFEHADAVRQFVTDLAVLITPMRSYPRGHRWIGADRPWERPGDG